MMASTAGTSADPGLQERALAYLAEHNTVSIATVGPDGPWAATVFYVNVGFVLYYLSEPKTEHVRNVLAHPGVAATINEDYRDWRAIKGIQMSATCGEVRGLKELPTALAAYVAKYPFVRQFLGPGQMLRGMRVGSKPLNVRMYRIRPSRLLFLDNERGFSDRREIPLEGRS